MDEFTTVVQSNISSLRKQQNEFLDKVNSAQKNIPQSQYVPINQINQTNQTNQTQYASSNQSNQPNQTQYVSSNQSPNSSKLSSQSPKSPPPSPQIEDISNMEVNNLVPNIPIMNMGIPSISNIPILEILMPMPINNSVKSSVVIEEDNDDDLDKLLVNEYKELDNQ